MNENNNSINISEDPEMAVLEKKLRDQLYELNNKQILVETYSSKLNETKVQKQELEWALEKSQRELEEIKIQLELVIKASRKGEAERNSGKEAFTRQLVQLEVVSKERDILQDQIKVLEVENSNLCEKFSQAEAQLKNYTCFQESCQARQKKDRIALESLSKQTTQLEQDHLKLKRMSCAAAALSKKAVLRFSQQRALLQEVTSERNALRKKMLSMTAEINRLTTVKIKAEEVPEAPNQFFNEWLSAQQAIEKRHKESEEHFNKMQSSLNSALAAMSKLQSELDESSKKICNMEEKLEELNKVKSEKVNSDKSKFPEMTPIIESQSSSMEVPD